MQIGMVILMIKNPLLGGVFFLVIHLYHGRVRNNMLHLDRPQKLSIMPWLWLHVRLFGCIGYLQIWVSIWKILHLYIVTIKVLFILLATMFFMSKPSILKQISILLIIIFNLAVYLYHLFLRSLQIADIFTKLWSVLCFGFLFDKLSMHLAITLWVLGDVNICPCV